MQKHNKLDNVKAETVQLYNFMKSTPEPITINEAVSELSKHGLNWSELEFRAHVRQLVEVGAVQVLGNRYRLLDSGALLCRQIELLIQEQNPAPAFAL